MKYYKSYNKGFEKSQERLEKYNVQYFCSSDPTCLGYLSEAQNLKVVTDLHRFTEKEMLACLKLIQAHSLRLYFRKNVE